MKGFVISILAAAPLLFFAGLLWPRRPPSTVGTAHVERVVAAVEKRYVDEWQPKSEVLATANTPFELSKDTIVFEPPAEADTSKPADAHPAVEPTPDEQATLKQTAVSSTKLRNADFPRTYISLIEVDLTSPNHWVRLTWTGPQAASQETGPFHSSPGAGLGYNNCDDPAESKRNNSNCTPKGTMHVQAFSETMVTSPTCRFVTWFEPSRGIAFHYYPFVPNYPASHGCVRLEEMHASQLVHNNSKIGLTKVIVAGKWTSPR
jgi:L,D-transpeptidase-like protein